MADQAEKQLEWPKRAFTHPSRSRDASSLCPSVKWSVSISACESGSGSAVQQPSSCCASVSELSFWCCFLARQCSRGEVRRCGEQRSGSRGM